MSTYLRPLKWYRELATKKGRSSAGAFAIEGRRSIEQIITGYPDKIIEILAVEEPAPGFRVYPVRQLSRSQFLSISSTKNPQGIMAVVREPEEIYSGNLPEAIGNKVLLLDDIQDPGNVGTLIRTAAAFDFSGVIMTEKCADPLSPKCVQATAGSVLSVWIRRTQKYGDLALSLRDNGYDIVAADLAGTEDTRVLGSRGKLLLVLGNEAAGLSKILLDMASFRMRIPTNREKAESLNVATCGAICMFLSSQIRTPATDKPENNKRK